MLDNNKRLKQLLLRMQARFRGAIVRQKLKSGVGIDGVVSNMKFIPRDPYGTHKAVKSSKIVLKSY